MGEDSLTLHVVVAIAVVVDALATRMQLHNNSRRVAPRGLPACPTTCMMRLSADEIVCHLALATQ